MSEAEGVGSEKSFFKAYFSIPCFQLVLFIKEYLCLTILLNFLISSSEGNKFLVSSFKICIKSPVP